MEIQEEVHGPDYLAEVLSNVESPAARDVPARQGPGCDTPGELSGPGATEGSDTEPVLDWESEDGRESAAAEIKAMYESPWGDMDMMFQVKEAREAAVALWHKTPPQSHAWFARYALP